jgi:hypothetical protein
MSYLYCHRCSRMMGVAPFCPHCGATQDEASRKASATKNRDMLIGVVPALLGMVAGYLIFDSVIAGIVGLVLGLAIGVGAIAVIFSRRAK